VKRFTSKLIAGILAVTATLGGLNLVRNASAEGNSTKQKLEVPVNSTVLDCNGNIITVTGTSTVRVHTTIDNAGGLHVQIHTNYDDLQAVNTVTGDIYSVNGGDKFSQNFGADGLPAIETFVSHFNFIGQGSAPNLKVTSQFHTTINNNGVLTADHSQFETNCKQ
jgi:hypothetical protein